MCKRLSLKLLSPNNPKQIPVAMPVTSIKQEIFSKQKYRNFVTNTFKYETFHKTFIKSNNFPQKNPQANKQEER